MVLGEQPRSGLHDRHRDPEADVHLRQLAAGRTATEDDDALRQLTGERRLAVRPRVGIRQSLDRRQLRHRAHGDEHVVRFQQVCLTVVADLDPAHAHDPGRPAIRGAARILERLDMRAVVRLGGVAGAIDHEVAACRGLPPGRVPAVVRGGGMQQRLRGDASDVRARPAEPTAVDDRHTRAELARLERGSFAGGAGADDDDGEAVHEGPQVAGIDALGRPASVPGVIPDGTLRSAPAVPRAAAAHRAGVAPHTAGPLRPSTR